MATPTPPTPTVQSRIVTRLRARGRRSAAFLVAADLRDSADGLAADIAPVGRLVAIDDEALAELVTLWGRGADALVADALEAWDISGCAHCAIATARGGGDILCGVRVSA